MVKCIFYQCDKERLNEMNLCKILSNGMTSDSVSVCILPPQCTSGPNSSWCSHLGIPCLLYLQAQFLHLSNETDEFQSPCNLNFPLVAMLLKCMLQMTAIVNFSYSLYLQLFIYSFSRVCYRNTPK